MKRYQVGDKVAVHTYKHGRNPNPVLSAIVTVERTTRNHAHLSDFGIVPVFAVRRTPKSDKRGHLSFAPATSKDFEALSEKK